MEGGPHWVPLVNSVSARGYSPTDGGDVVVVVSVVGAVVVVVAVGAEVVVPSPAVVSVVSESHAATSSTNAMTTAARTLILRMPVPFLVHTPGSCRSDVVGGAIIYANKKLEERGRFLVNALGVSESQFGAAEFDTGLGARIR